MGCCNRLTDADLAEALRIFRREASEFAEYPDDDLTDMDGNVSQYGIKGEMRIQARLLSKRHYGDLYTLALAYLTAHYLKMSGEGEDEGYGSLPLSFRLASASEGETSVSFSDNTSSSDSDSEYTLTVYGRKFLSIKRSVTVGIVSAGEPNIPPFKGYPDCCCHHDGRRGHGPVF